MTKTNGVVTKSYLDKKVKNFVTKSYLDKKLKNFVTKNYLDKKLQTFKVELKDEIKDELYEIKDDIVGEIKAMREEFDTHQFSHTRINDDLQDHEKRIAVLEA